jgi:hypothetical protein
MTEFRFSADPMPRYPVSMTVPHLACDRSATGLPCDAAGLPGCEETGPRYDDDQPACP